MMIAGHLPVVTPDLQTDAQALFLHSSVFPSIAAESVDEARQDGPGGALRLKMSQVLQLYLDHRETEDGDQRAESEVEPIIKFAIALLEGPVMMDINGDNLFRFVSSPRHISPP